MTETEICEKFQVNEAFRTDLTNFTIVALTHAENLDIVSPHFRTRWRTYQDFMANLPDIKILIEYHSSQRDEALLYRSYMNIDLNNISDPILRGKVDHSRKNRGNRHRNVSTIIDMLRPLYRDTEIQAYEKENNIIREFKSNERKLKKQAKLLLSNSIDSKTNSDGNYFVILFFIAFTIIILY